MGSLPGDLIGPDLSLVETHISWVLLGATEVWKIKKPVDFGFLDFRTIERRRAACEAEVRLNRRLAPDVYLGVVPITVGHDGRLRLGGDGSPVDFAVHMRRLPDEVRADLRLDGGELDLAAIEIIAARLARFHAECPEASPEDRASSIDTVRRNVRENFGQTRDTIEQHLAPPQARELENKQLAFLASHEESLRARAGAGRIRDGHGDLRLEHIYLEPGRPPTIIDCIEFNERFRIADVCCDLAFLSMDLAFRGRVDLAEHLLALYARDSGDYDIYGLVDFYESYRAHVRAKVALLLAEDPGAARPVREAARDQARRYFLLALAKEREPLVSPVLVAVGGVIASGKSTLAAHVAHRLGAPVVESDRTRKSLAGVLPDQNLASGHFTGAYSPERTAQVYEELLRRAAVVLGSGRSVVLDASFRTQAQRSDALKLSEQKGVPFYFIECRAPAEQLRERLEARSTRSGEISDARSDLLDEFLAQWEPEDRLPADQHLSIDTGLPLDSTLAQLGAQLPFWPS